MIGYQKQVLYAFSIWQQYCSWNVIHVFKICILFCKWKGERERQWESMIFCAMLHSPNCHNSHSWIKWAPGAKISMWVFPMHSRSPSTWAIPCYLPGVWARRWIRSRAVGSNQHLDKWCQHCKWLLTHCTPMLAKPFTFKIRDNIDDATIMLIRDNAAVCFCTLNRILLQVYFSFREKSYSEVGMQAISLP